MELLRDSQGTYLKFIWGNMKNLRCLIFLWLRVMRWKKENSPFPVLTHWWSVYSKNKGNVFEMTSTAWLGSSFAEYRVQVLEPDRPGFKSRLYHLLYPWPWASYQHRVQF